MSFTPDPTSAVRPWQAVYPQVGITPELPTPEHQSLAHLIHEAAAGRGTPPAAC